MTRHLVRETSPGEIRTGLFENGKLTEFRIARPHLDYAPPGTRLSASILYRNGGKTFADIGRGMEAQLQNAPDLPLGTKIPVDIIRPPIPEPGRWKRAIARTCDSDPVAPAPIDDIPVLSDLESIEAAGFDELTEAAIRGEFPFAGGMLSIERTRAMTMIDIDGGGDPLTLNIAAAREIPRLLRLLDIGGQIGIDFLSLPDRKTRMAVDEALANAAAPILGQHERTAMNGFGFVQLVRPRLRASIPEIMCGTLLGRPSLETRATGLLRLAARSKGHGKRQLIATPAVVTLVKSWTEELDEVRKLLGTEIELVSDATATGYGYVHASQ